MDAVCQYLKKIVEAVPSKPAKKLAREERAPSEFSCRMLACEKVETQDVSSVFKKAKCLAMPEKREVVIKDAIQDEFQDVNHNQEVFYGLLNESLGCPQKLFRSEKRNEILARKARKELRTFKLYGMLLWDQYRDVYIEKTVAKKYGTLQENAGDYFKLILLFSRFQAKYGDVLGGVFDGVTSKIVNDPIYMRTFLSALNVSDQSVPYLVIITSLTSNEALLVPAHEVDELPEVISSLEKITTGDQVSLVNCQSVLSRVFGMKSEILDLGDRNFAQRLIAPLTEIMLNENSGIRAQVESPATILSRARKELFDLRDDLKVFLDGLESGDRGSVDYEARYEEYENLCMELLNIAAISQQGVSDYKRFGIPSHMVNCLDDESKINLESAVKGMAMYDYFRGDLSPITVALGKMFENEMNTSMVQYIREKLGILMPRYFFRLYPQQGRQYVVDETDFNRCSGCGLWLAPENGCTRSVVFKNEPYGQK